MKGRTLFVAVLVVLLSVGLCFAQEGPYKQAGRFIASEYDGWSLSSATSIAGGGAATVTVDRCNVETARPGGKRFNPLIVNSKVTLSDSNSETVTVTAATFTNGVCTFTATFSNAHTGGSYTISSGTHGLAEAIADAIKVNGGVVEVGPMWQGATSDITGILAYHSSVLIEDVRGGAVVKYRLQPTTLSALATPATRSATANATQVISGTATGTWTAAATYVCVTYVDALGGESPCSATYNFTATVNKALNFAAPAASTGAVGWRAYAGASYAAAYLLPISSTVCTLSTLETVYPACAMGAAGVFPDPVTTSSLHPGYVVNTYNPNTQSHTTFGYMPSNSSSQAAFQSDFGPFIASAGGTTGQIEVLGTVPLPSGYLNYIGRAVKVSGKITMTAGTSETPVLKVMLGPTFTTGTPTMICDFRNTTALSAAVYAMDFECRMTTNATGASGTIMAGGRANVALGAGTTAGTGMPELGTAAVTDKLDAVHYLYVVYVPTSGTNTAAQLLDLHVETIN